MKLKLDENLSARGAELLRQAGHDVATVYEQKLAGTPDPEVIQYCRTEQRALVTLDLDFSNTLRFKPADYAGIAVLRIGRDSSYGDLMIAVRTLVDALDKEPIQGRLWIVERGRIRVHQEGDSPCLSLHGRRGIRWSKSGRT